ncbi:MAG TPA: M23 family metallopeptidase [Candidatus Sulfotelmatobacter sp.]
MFRSQVIKRDLRPYRARSFRFVFELILPAAILIGSISLSHAATSIQIQPPRPVNGAPVLFRVKSSVHLESLTGVWLGHHINFSFDPSSKTWFALAGVSLETKPGSYALELSGKMSEAKPEKDVISLTRKFTVTKAKYPKVELTVSKQFTEPDPEQVKQIQVDQDIKKDYLNRVTADREWVGKFNAPAKAAISDVFGTQRVFNGKTQSSHLGLDFRVPSGTPVEAMNDGTVLLAQPLYFEGNCVVIDHGQGLLTIYMHLSEFTVKEGERIKRGDRIGFSGGSGRATGPHLHVSVRWQGAYLDPASLMRLSLPGQR